MREIDSGGPAFPMSHEQKQTGVWGLTKREWFAGMALQGHLANASTTTNTSCDREGLVNDCFLMADAMLRAGEVKK
ncbi:MAG: hypothetical protein JNK54_06430 [Elusimicrobia bacterium]|nr:hypothetical protein [Elusimicrobiota bacterium]